MHMLISAGSLADDSSCLKLARKAADHVPEHVDTTFIDPHDLEIQFCDARSWDEYNEDTTEWQQAVDRADRYLFAVPVYNWSYSGVFKNMVDLVPPDSWEGTTGFMAKGNNNRGYLMLQRELRSLMAYFGVTTVPETVYATDKDFTDGDLASQDIERRIERLVQALIDA
ncbi:MAG: NADPH-dependent FMN reductase [Candidatus Nanohaloarchaea archaeon]|nr:NADPH-dependent FMN reductase [Candidatus Nanohaloarchaea archaeon]